MAPATLLLLGDWRGPRFWLAAALPGLSYALYVSLLGSVARTLGQMGSHSGGFIALGLLSYARGAPAILAGALWGWLASRAAARGSATGILMSYGLPLALAVAMSRGAQTYHALSLALLGAALAATARLPAAHADLRRVGLLALATAWSVSLSIGYNTPALAAGALALLLLACGRAAWSGGRTLPTLAAAALALTVVVSQASARSRHVYRDRPAAELLYPLDGVFPGAAHIRTGAETYRLLADLREAVRKTEGAEYAIVPGPPSYWAGAPRPNPLPMDWPSRTAFSDGPTRERVIESLASRRGRIVVLVDSGSEPHPLSRYVRENFTRAGRAGSFELYR